MCSRRMMTRLLTVQNSTICTFSLVCLSQNWIQRLVKRVVLPEERDRRCYDSFKSFHRVIFQRCCVIEVEREAFLNVWYSLQQTFWAHTFDWKTNSCQIEISTHYFFTYGFQDFSACTSQLGLELHIFDLKASVVWCI